jgi:hypothetical protein
LCGWRRRSTEARIDARQFEAGPFHFALTAETKVAIDGRDADLAYRSCSHPAPVAAGAHPRAGGPA